MSAPGWEVVIGMEVHVQLRTRTKMFCRCSADYLGDPPNTHVCEVCLGMPGVLPVINRAAVEQCLKAALALECEVAEWTKFDRKNYFYPDLPKGYQISQYDLPMSRAGRLEVDGREIRITRVHLEEDTGKSVHAGDSLAGAERSYVDLNRAGIPLMEVVSEPDLRSSEEARAYAMALRSLMRAIGASNADMEKGQLRAEANVSVRPAGTDELGVKTELKNINSFRALKLAIDHEVARQVGVIEGGGAVLQETRGWDEARGVTYSQRSKEYAQDYRYFPEPDLPPLEISREWLDSLRAGLPELPAARRARYVSELGLSEYDAGLLVSMGDYFDAVVSAGVAPKTAANWLIGEIAPRLDERPEPPAVEGLAGLLQLVESGRVNRDQARSVLRDAWESGADPVALVAERGLEQVTDEAALEGWVAAALEAQPQAAADFRAGKQQALGALMNEIRRLSNNSADMKRASELLRARLLD
ncbi:MAG TPA: Asp-tRNA(Asn)/Glu-tRNA(Gln) amidotransferase subunit GatB [Candidatus Dormibacteraeota bacterium]